MKIKAIALLWLGLLIGGVVMAQAPTGGGPVMSNEEFWKRYKMPTSTPNPSQLKWGGPYPTAMQTPASPSAKSQSEWQAQHPEFMGQPTVVPTALNTPIPLQKIFPHP
jgi:hypothetical protein